ncbi:MAG TPA: DUF4388 domain-containing protein [Planctomycetota bacterium]
MSPSRKDWPGPGPRRAHGAWKTIPLSEVTEHAPAARGPHPMDLEAPGLQREIESRETSLVDNLRRLDSVVHDFIACLDQSGPASPPALVDEAESENIARFTRILRSKPTGGPVLGPAVICGMSPPIHLESLFGFLGSLRKTGMLRVLAEDTTFMISVVRGDVVHAVSNRRPEAELLGNILVARQAIDRYELDRFFLTCGPSACKIGEALNRQELVSTQELRGALEIQLQQLFDRLLAVRSAEWCFHEGEVTLPYINLRVNATRVLLESARKRDEDHSTGT